MATITGASTTAEPGQTVDEGKGRIFPCEGCGADLTFHINQQKLVCPYCGHEKNLQIAESAVVEHDFQQMLAKLSRQRAEGHEDRVLPQEVRCAACGATIAFTGTLTSTECPYCAKPIQREDVHENVEHRVPVDGVLPFMVDKDQAQANLRKWVRKLWFAPGAFKKRGVRGKFTGVYMPYWTFDTMTSNYYSGARGEYYYVETGVGDNKRRERKVRWYPESGAFNRFFDDVLVCAGSGLSDARTQALEPWPLEKVLPFTQEVLAGFMARTYDLPLAPGMESACARIDAALRADVRNRIGGDTQRVDQINTQYQAVTYKHLLLPVWLMAYRYNNKLFQVVVNAATGEVYGDRPWSAWKIIGLIAAILFAIAVIVVLGSAFSS